MSDWIHKVVLITGGSSGIGKAAAERFLKERATVYIIGRNTEKLSKVKKELSDIHPTIYTISANIAIPSECKRVVEVVLLKEQRLDVLVNSAGVYFEGPTVEMTEEIWDETIDINLKGTFFMSKYAISALAESQGSIVNVSSDAGLVGNNEAAIYCASKGGVTLLTKAMAMELAKRKVRVNAVCPGVVETPMVQEDFEKSSFDNRKEYDAYYLSHYPQGENARYTQPEEVAECIYFLASKDKVEAITGTCLSIDFGITAGY